MKNFFLFLIIISLGISCSSDDDTGVNIRISNVSESNFENVSVLSFSLEKLSSGETSEFRKFEKAFGIAPVSLEIEGEFFGLPVIDFVGEEPLPNGNYTYEIGLNQSGESLTLHLVQE